MKTQDELYEQRMEYACRRADQLERLLANVLRLPQVRVIVDWANPWRYYAFVPGRRTVMVSDRDIHFNKSGIPFFLELGKALMEP